MVRANKFGKLTVHQVYYSSHAIARARITLVQCNTRTSQPQETPRSSSAVLLQVKATPALDSWSVGVVLYHMCTGRALFESFSDDTLGPAELQRLANWSDKETSKSIGLIRHRFAKHLVSQLLQWDPSQRISIADSLQHPFVTGHLPSYELVHTYACKETCTS